MFQVRWSLTKLFGNHCFPARDKVAKITEILTKLAHFLNTVVSEGGCFILGLWARRSCECVELWPLWVDRIDLFGFIWVFASLVVLGCYVQVCHPWREHPPDRARRGATSSWSRSASGTRRNTRQEPRPMRPMEQTVRRKLWKMWWYVVKLWSLVKCSEVKWPDDSTWTKTICVYIYILWLTISQITW